MSQQAQIRIASASLRALLDGLIDYAGLFPPAALDMKTAVSNYAHYLASEHRWALGRFIVPVARLGEFARAQRDLLTPDLLEFLDNAANATAAIAVVSMTGNPLLSLLFPERSVTQDSIARLFPWRVSAIAASESDFEAIAAFNSKHAGRTLIDAVEIKAASIDDVRKLRPLVPAGVTPYFEVPWDSRPELFQTIASVNARAKIRTGGVVETAFPPAHEIAQFLLECAKAKCAFKATAGLHHPVRCVKPLTYEPNAPTGKMHGFLNVFVAAILAREGVRSDAVEAVLLNEHPGNFIFTDDKCEVRAVHSVEKDGATHNTNFAIDISTERIRTARETFAIAFGSCSFTEPIEDLRSLHLL